MLRVPAVDWGDGSFAVLVHEVGNGPFPVTGATVEMLRGDVPLRVYDLGDGSFALGVRQRRLAESVTVDGQPVFVNGRPEEVDDEQGHAVVTPGYGPNQHIVTVQRGDPVFVYVD